jgi:tetratricopeptide (TPR) repeat protein
MELATMQITVFDPGDGERAVRREIRPLFTGKLREFRGDLDGPNGAKAAYLLARPSSARIRELVAKVPPQQAEVVRRLYEQLKQDAAYALGLVMLREGQFEAAADYLGRMTLEAHPDSRWADAARVALADAVAALGRIDEARKLLEADESPQRFGSRLRAERLTDQAAERR